MTIDHLPKPFDFWNDHSLEFLEMAMRKDYRERIDHPDGYGKRTGECGDTIEFFLMEQYGRLGTISYDIDGCLNTNACANSIVELARGKSIESAWDITEQDIVDFLKTLPENETHCAQLAIGAFYLALKNMTTDG